MKTKRRRVLGDEKEKAVERQIEDFSRNVAYYITEYNVEYLAKKFIDGEYIKPDYQRNFIWHPDNQSRFVESVIMGLPIPFLFFFEKEQDGKLEIVDGVQRMNTLASFIFGKLKLRKLKKLTELNGLTFQDLSPARQRKITNKSIRGIVLSEHADEDTRQDIFHRINTSSVQANPAEIRRGSLPGDFMELIKKLAQSPVLQKIAPVSPDKKKGREDEELVTRFFAYGDGTVGYNNNPADFMYAYVERMNEEAKARPEILHEYEKRFYTVMEFIAENIPNAIKKSAKSKSTPRARFESIAVGFCRALKEDPNLKIPVDFFEWLESQEFLSVVTSDAANTNAKLFRRLDVVKNKLLNG